MRVRSLAGGDAITDYDLEGSLGMCREEKRKTLTVDVLEPNVDTPQAPYSRAL